MGVGYGLNVVDIGVTVYSRRETPEPCLVTGLNDVWILRNRDALWCHERHIYGTSMPLAMAL